MPGKPETESGRPASRASAPSGKHDEPSIQSDTAELRRQLDRGSIQRAYRALLSYMTGLRSHFEARYGRRAVSGLYQGYLDMTYFALFPPSLKRRNLKVARVFNSGAFRFEAWLSARNRPIQRQYWELFKNSPWEQYRVVTPAAGVDSILECDLARDFNLSAPNVLTVRIETAVAAFIENVERFLARAQHDAARAPSPARRSRQKARV